MELSIGVCMQIRCCWVVNMPEFIVDFVDISEIFCMLNEYLFFCWFFNLHNLKAICNHNFDFNVSICKQRESLPIEKCASHFHFVEQQAEFIKSINCWVGLVFVEDKNWTNLISSLHCILYESLVFCI